uniref:GOLGA2L5 domain-containing protein n=1 Tax=Echinostoma caproni TaxID=27848 RepID=A0A183A415_9TREM
LAKRVRQAERDVVEWQGKWELSQRSLLELVEEHKKKTEEAAASKKQSERLAGLCRALQHQLSELRRPTANPPADQSTPSVPGDGDSQTESGRNNTVPDGSPTGSEVEAEQSKPDNETPLTEPESQSVNSQQNGTANRDESSSRL